ncbi:LPP20 family lipoprotein [Vibrio tritonius]|uniref:LPP20 family lipoprotein n=1 Tax=Vibrio tritonius TaxID=1435069 RepID=A0ABS7YNM4_9VIBR|nr:LPP20 family lipoprotein [Vibrio tritonius]MCA2017280.1 LPP20 family lipoprotein [Vibrio tritonius]
MKKLIALSVITLALAGCKTVNTGTIEEAQNFAQCTFPDSPTVEAPSWICDVMPKDLAIGATGYAKKSVAGMSVMRKIAINDARVNLAAEFQTDVNNMFKQAIESTTKTTTATGADENVVESFESATKNIVTRSLTNSRLIVSQASPAGGLYVLVGMDQNAYDANVNKVVDAANSDSKLWKQFNDDKAAKDLQNALTSLKKM